MALAVFMGATHYLENSFAIYFNAMRTLVAHVFLGSGIGDDVADSRKQMDCPTFCHAAVANWPWDHMACSSQPTVFRGGRSCLSAALRSGSDRRLTRLPASRRISLGLALAFSTPEAMNLKPLVHRIPKDYPAPLGRHPRRWALGTASGNGLRLAEATGAKVEVVQLFAVFHDSRRIDDNHGRSGSDLAAELRGSLFDLPDADFALLYEACAC